MNTNRFNEKTNQTDVIKMTITNENRLKKMINIRVTFGVQTD